ncbi:kinase-like domain-containing protein [Rhizophagus irregularis DAOM 181602=DAOM 197198]|uniref:Kinase-like domain-containing protein n=2 Tax=Rhizophagus irregularis TaxID=588596 RepID=A0A2P4PZ31_RHIID|nr:kinase-like domain-containing protein [Rhizophagus irregularis DAOM 181602=DAOM 197198]POG70644.1 kinase-like domain-containing protein [Rhizophagus irregularis DAOM 181602=DAOM 197198]|eukprot:XP_025177510.1 kinase-like domain-containing protein [Rhizophagus irregularis DAOM 181602=DAOM 197198]
MSYNDKIYFAIEGAFALIDYNIYNDIHKQFEFKKQTVLADESLTENEKSEAITILTKTYDDEKITFNEGTKRICENCNQECLATLFCELCVRNYLKANFSNWTSGNVDIDNLLQECQMKTLAPNRIPEWIPYDNLKNIKYLTKGGCSEIYTADWINGKYKEWDSKKQQLKRFGEHVVVLKILVNVENANQNWFDEAKSHLNMSNKWTEIVQCFGLTQDPSNGNYMLVMYEMDIDLRKYLQQNHNKLTWKERIQIAENIIFSLIRIHEENAIHRDLHSGNLLLKNFGLNISDLGFCGPADKPLKSIYGNLPYMAPEVIIGKVQTNKSDIYSVAMLMWEISSGQPPFINYEHNYDLAMNIVNGIRPKIVPGTPLEYKNLMKQCWDADPFKRPDVAALWKKIKEINLFYQNKSNESLTQPEVNNNLEWKSIENYTSSSSSLSASKLHQFDNLPEPRNATEEELEAFYSKSYDLSIPDNIDEFDKSGIQKNIRSYPKYLKGIQRMANIQNDYKGETMQQKVKKNNINVDDEDEIYYNNPNFHLEEQNEFELPDGN